MQAEVHGRHGDEAALAVHDAVVVAEGVGAGAAEGVAGYEGNGGEGEGGDCGEQGEEAFGVGVGVCVGFF